MRLTPSAFQDFRCFVCNSNDLFLARTYAARLLPCIAPQLSCLTTRLDLICCGLPSANHNNALTKTYGVHRTGLHMLSWPALDMRLRQSWLQRASKTIGPPWSLRVLGSCLSQAYIPFKRCAKASTLRLLGNFSLSSRFPGSPRSSMASTGSPAAAGSPPPSAGAHKSQGPNTNEMLVYWLDIGLFGVLALFFLAVIPRAYGRMAGFSISKGLILRSGPPRETGYSISKPNLNYNPARYPTHEFGGQGMYRPPTITPPLHVPSLSSVLHPMSSFFSRSFTADKTYGKIILSLIDLAGILVAVFYAGDPLAHPARLGLIAVSQIPFVIALGTKNNSIGMLLSIGYERVRMFDLSRKI